MNFTQEEYEKKREEIINKFSKGFIEKTYNYNPYTVKVIELLIRDESPYSIIETLILNQDELIKKYEKALDLLPVPPIQIQP